MEELTLSVGYKMIRNVVGEKYADIIYDVACTNKRNKIYFPMYANKSCGALKRVLPHDVLRKLSEHFGGQAIYVRKDNLKIDDAKEKEWAARTLAKAGATADTIARVLGVTKKTVLNCYVEQRSKPVDNSGQRQLCLF